MKEFIIIFLVGTVMNLSCMVQKPKTKNPVSVIFDSDIGPDYDDVGAITLLHALADSGKANILATIASNKYSRISSVINVFNTYFQRWGIPVGVPKGDAVDEADSQHWSDTLVAKYPHRIKSNAEAEDAVMLYRKILSKQPDKSVTIVTVGFLTNLDNLLISKPDQYSNLGGKELIAKKVKLLVSMAGAFPSGREFNVFKDAAASQRVFPNWPTEVIFSGFEIGEKIKTGLPLIKNAAIQNSPTKDVFRISIPKDKGDENGRMSWDETAVLIAINSPSPYYNLVSGRIVVNDDGSNTWNAAQKGQYYLTEKMPVEQVTALINKLMMHQPK